MTKSQKGFSVAEIILVIGIIALVGGVGFFVYNKAQSTKKADTANSQTGSSTKSATPVAGTTESIDAITAQDAASEATIDSKYSESEQTTAQSSNAAAANVGGSFDETSL